MLLQASTGIRPCPPAKWPICVKDGAVKADQHPATAPRRRNPSTAYAAPGWPLRLLPLSLKSATILGRGPGEGSQNAIWADAFAGKNRYSSSPASKLADLRKRRCSPKRTSTLQLCRGEGIKLWLTLCRAGRVRGPENAIQHDTYAGRHRHSSLPASEVADLRQKRCGQKRPHPT